MKIAIAGTGHVGLSLAVLLAQHNEVHALDIIPEKIEKLRNLNCLPFLGQGEMGGSSNWGTLGQLGPLMVSSSSTM